MQILKKEEITYKQLNSTQTREQYSLSALVSDLLGSKQLFFHHDIIAPGKKSSGAHRHTVIEEVVYISKGSASVYFGGEKRLVPEGSFILFDPKETKTHFVANETDQDLETITVAVKNGEDKVIVSENETWRLPVLESQRIILRPIELEDAEDIFNYAQNPNVSRYTLWEPHKTIQDSLNYIQDYVFDRYAKGVPDPWAITLKSQPNKVIGTVGCFWVNKTSKSMELAYAISENYWGQGLVAEA